MIELKGVVTPVISNLAYAIGLFIGDIAEREKSIGQRNERGQERLFTTKNTKLTKKERMSGIDVLCLAV
ncbi:MAG: hypothetical protein IPQ05_05640 [Leptospiraceae bacterium]|nr:hypothetical protein [Leptospiraceae bacterium]MBL0263358.1 hypothetical protein [Leptospiraceae bacterium]